MQRVPTSLARVISARISKPRVKVPNLTYIYMHTYHFVEGFWKDIRHFPRKRLVSRWAHGSACGITVLIPHADHVGGVEGIALSVRAQSILEFLKTEWLSSENVESEMRV